MRHLHRRGRGGATRRPPLAAELWRRAQQPRHCRRRQRPPQPHARVGGGGSSSSKSGHTAGRPPTSAAAVWGDVHVPLPPHAAAGTRPMAMEGKRAIVGTRKTTFKADGGCKERRGEPPPPPPTPNTARPNPLPPLPALVDRPRARTPATRQTPGHNAGARPRRRRPAAPSLHGSAKEGRTSRPCGQPGHREGGGAAVVAAGRPWHHRVQCRGRANGRLAARLSMPVERAPPVAPHRGQRRAGTHRRLAPCTAMLVEGAGRQTLRPRRPMHRGEGGAGRAPR